MPKQEKEEVLEEILEDLEKESTTGDENPSEENAAKTEENVSEGEQASGSAEAPDSEEASGGEETPEAEDAPEQETKEGRGLFKKKKTDKKQDALQDKINELQDKCIRQMAEFENFRKRTEKEKSAMFDMGAKSVIEKILPVVDNFERGLATVPEDDREKPFADGMNMTYKQLLTELEKLGVKPIEAIGTPFNPDLHNAVMQVESEEFESGIVAQELLKGYMYHDSVVRHSMVGVVS